LNSDKQDSWQNRLQSVAVFGAGGKMGSGIAWVVLQTVAKLDASQHGVPGSGIYALVLIDANRLSFQHLQPYLRSQLLKYAEKSIEDLRTWARDRVDLVENSEIIQAFVEGAMSLVRFETEVTEARDARLVFEAVFEDLQLKTQLYTHLKSIGQKDAWYLTNTSSIPISILDKSAGLSGRILGFHFYNPPAVQKLVEMIVGTETPKQLVQLGYDLGKAFGKIVVPARDKAGFIGNGHFIREGLFAMRKFQELRGIHGDAEAFLAINRVTQDFLIRPMGIFQLMDYVGLDVFRMIMKVMGEYLGTEEFSNAEIDLLLASGIKGGQVGSGEQKNGIFQYDRNKLIGVWDANSKGYLALSDGHSFTLVNTWLGSLPEKHITWASLSRDRDQRRKVTEYLSNLAGIKTHGASLARDFLNQSRLIAKDLEQSGVAATQSEVSSVLMNGFYHLYGPADWIHQVDK
jgi:3-hydroxyacyl-CoA dehydrogenase